MKQNTGCSNQYLRLSGDTQTLSNTIIKDDLDRQLIDNKVEYQNLRFDFQKKLEWNTLYSEGPYAKESPTTIVLRVHLLMEEKQFWGDDRTVKRDNILMGQERSMYFFFSFSAKGAGCFSFPPYYSLVKRKSII